MATDWIVGPEVATSTPSASLDMTGWEGGEYRLEMRVHDGHNWSSWTSEVALPVSPWKYGQIVASSVAAGTIDTSQMEDGLYEVQVTTWDNVSVDPGPWSAVVQMKVSASNVYLLTDSGWINVTRFVFTGGTWAQHQVTRL